jgi:hypothetical protein
MEWRADHHPEEPVRLSRGATRADAREEVCRMFARDALKSSPSIWEWWDSETRRTVVSLEARELRARLGLKR